MLCSGQEGFPKISFLISFFCFHPISDLLQWPVSVYKAPAQSPRQAAQAAQLHQEPQQEGTATGEELELSTLFLFGDFLFSSILVLQPSSLLPS